MYRFNGTLMVKKINGQYGEFAVGTVETPIGDFSVKQAELDQFDEGFYQGKFSISRIETKASNFGNHKMVLESRATLDEIKIAGIDAKNIDAEIEADPILESNTADVVSVAPAVSDSDDLLNLFNKEQIKAINGKQSVELDYTNRVLLRQQSNYLTSAGWEYDPQKRQWHFKT